jgi:hypothetical protein
MQFYFRLPDLDLTGSPLAYPFSSDDYDDDTFISGPIKHWQKDEESHGSLSVIKARYVFLRSYIAIWVPYIW